QPPGARWRRPVLRVTASPFSAGSLSVHRVQRLDRRFQHYVWEWREKQLRPRGLTFRHCPAYELLQLLGLRRAGGEDDVGERADRVGERLALRRVDDRDA